MNKKKGGEKIGEGANGCIFRPPLTCSIGKTKSNKNYVGKVFNSETNGKFEETIMKKINIIDPKGYHIIPLNNKCIVKSKDIRLRDKFNECGITRSEQMTQLIYEDGGISLYDFCNKNRSKYSIFDMINGFVNIVDGLVKMNKVRLCHRDLKPQNIMINEDNMLMRMTDFGLSKEHNLIYNVEELYLLEHVYPYYPLEFKLYAFLIWNYDKKTKVTSEDLHKLKKKISMYFYSNEYTTNYRIQYEMVGHNKEQISNQINSAVDNICKKVLKKQIDPSKINERFETISDKIDVFSCGICMMNAMMLSDDDTKSALVKEFISVISDAINFDPITRISIDDLQLCLHKLKRKIDKQKKQKKKKVTIEHYESPIPTKNNKTRCTKVPKSKLISLVSSKRKRRTTASLKRKTKKVVV